MYILPTKIRRSSYINAARNSRYIALIMLLAGLSPACRMHADQHGFRHTVLQGKYALDIPSYLVTDKKLKGPFDLAYSDTLNHTFLVISSEKKSDIDTMQLHVNIDGYFNFAQTGIVSRLSNVTLSPATTFRIGDMQAKSGSLEGNFGSSRVFYMLGVIESENYFYQIVFWTKAPPEVSAENDFSKVMHSFSEM